MMTRTSTDQWHAFCKTDSILPQISQYSNASCKKSWTRVICLSGQQHEAWWLGCSILWGLLTSLVCLLLFYRLLSFRCPLVTALTYTVVNSKRTFWLSLFFSLASQEKAEFSRPWVAKSRRKKATGGVLWVVLSGERGDWRGERMLQTVQWGKNETTTPDDSNLRRATYTRRRMSNDNDCHCNYEEVHYSELTVLKLHIWTQQRTPLRQARMIGAMLFCWLK